MGGFCVQATPTIFPVTSGTQHWGRGYDRPSHRVKHGELSNIQECRSHEQNPSSMLETLALLAFIVLACPCLSFLVLIFHYCCCASVCFPFSKMEA